MNRRGFFQLMAGAVGGIILEQAIPFNRVWSFPKKIVIADLNAITLKYIEPTLVDQIFKPSPLYRALVSGFHGDISTVLRSVEQPEQAAISWWRQHEGN